MHICYFGTYDKSYPRNRIIIEGLKKNGIEVDECHVPLWHNTNDKVNISTGKWFSIRFLFRTLKAYSELIIRHGFKLRKYDAVILGYSGQIDAVLAKILTSIWGIPLILDVFISIFLAFNERGLNQSRPITTKIIYDIEKAACKLADWLFIDTSLYADFLCQTYNLPKDKIKVVPLGANENIFFPVSSQETTNIFRILYFGKFIPLHGTDVIIKAAHLLRQDKDIHFRMHGEGPLKKRALEKTTKLGLNNVTFTDWISDPEALSYEFAPYDVCLGAFGGTQVAQMTIQNKIYEGLAMRKAVITGDSLAVENKFESYKHLIVCSDNDPEVLANAIRLLRDDRQLCHRIANAGYQEFIDHYTTAAIGRQVLTYLEEIVAR
jgi:glycosyltransferase involved in cell wall biosynthesis